MSVCIQLRYIDRHVYSVSTFETINGASGIWIAKIKD